MQIKSNNSQQKLLDARPNATQLPYPQNVTHSILLYLFVFSVLESPCNFFPLQHEALGYPIRLSGNKNP